MSCVEMKIGSFLVVLTIYVLISQCLCQNSETFNTTVDYLYENEDSNNDTNDGISDYVYDRMIVNEILNNEKVVKGEDLARLRNALLHFYDKKSRPTFDSSKPILVQIGFAVSQINKLDEVFQVMTSTLQLSVRWNDEFLKWNSSLYSNAITFKHNEIWVPDIMVSNNVNSFKFDADNSFQYAQSNNIFDFNERNKYFILVNANGDCRWVFPLKVLTICELNQDYFPFDVQNCHIDFRSSAFVNEQLILKKFGRGLTLNLINEAEFDLINATAIELTQNKSLDVELNGDVSVVRVNLLMKRKILFYLNKLIMPYFVFYIVILLTYIVPVESGEKKSYSTSILISAMIYLKDVSAFIPKTSLLPMLSIYFNLNLVIIFVCLMLTTIIYLIYYHYRSKTPISGICKKLVEVSRYALHENKLFETHLDNFELKNIRDKLVKLNQNLFIFNEYVSEVCERPKERQIEDVLGKDVLNTVKALKTYILKNNDLNESVNLNKNKPVFTKENVEISKYLNTLENLKLSLIKTKKSKSSQDLNAKSNPIWSSTKSLNQQLDGFYEGKKARLYLESLKTYKNQIKMYIKEIKKPKNIHDFTFYMKDASDRSGQRDHLFVHQWKYLAMIADRFIFFFFSVITPVSLLLLYLKTIFFN